MSNIYNDPANYTLTEDERVQILNQIAKDAGANLEIVEHVTKTIGFDLGMTMCFTKWDTFWEVNPPMSYVRYFAEEHLKHKFDGSPADGLCREIHARYM